MPWTGLEASTRAYAKIVDEVNKLPLEHVPAPGAAEPETGGAGTANLDRQAAPQ